MRGERGQAGVEWMAIVLTVAILLAGLGRFARREEDDSLARALTHSLTCATRDGCGPARSMTCATGDGCRPARVVGIGSEKRTESQPPRREAFTAPPLMPHSVRAPTRASHRPIGRTLLEWAHRKVARELGGGAGPELPGRLRRELPGRLRRELPGRLRRELPGRLREGAGRAWRTAWFWCLVYERVRWAVLHPESRSHEYELPPSEAVRMVNDCISPLDLVRDWPLITDR